MPNILDERPAWQGDHVLDKSIRPLSMNGTKNNAKESSADKLTLGGRDAMLVGLEKLSIEQEYQQMRTMLNEKQWRQYLAAEAQRRESISQVARLEEEAPGGGQ